VTASVAANPICIDSKKKKYGKKKIVNIQKCRQRNVRCVPMCEHCSVTYLRCQEEQSSSSNNRQFENLPQREVGVHHAFFVFVFRRELRVVLLVFEDPDQRCRNQEHETPEHKEICNHNAQALNKLWNLLWIPYTADTKIGNCAWPVTQKNEEEKPCPSFNFRGKFRWKGKNAELAG
jgi:hypothetical protein